MKKFNEVHKRLGIIILFNPTVFWLAPQPQHDSVVNP